MEDNRPGGEALFERLARARSILERERREAPGLAAELLALPVSLQLDHVNRDPRLATWGLCELLLARSQELTGADPAESGRIAGLALAASQGLDLELHAAPLVYDFKARTWATAGEAWLQAGELRRAEEALGAAAACLAHGTGDMLLDAQLLEFEGEVRRDQGRRGEADGLFKQAAVRYAALREHTLEARALARRAQSYRSTPCHAPLTLAFEPSR